MKKILLTFSLLVCLIGDVKMADPPKLFTFKIEIRLKDGQCFNYIYENDETSKGFLSLKEKVMAGVKYAYKDQTFFFNSKFKKFECPWGVYREPVVQFEITSNRNITKEAASEPLRIATKHDVLLISSKGGSVRVRADSLKNEYTYEKKLPSSYVRMEVDLFLYHFCELKSAFRVKLASKLILPNGNGTYNPNDIYFYSDQCYDSKSQRLKKAVVTFFLVAGEKRELSSTRTQYAYKVLDQMHYDGSLWKVGLGLHKEVDKVEYFGANKDDSLTDVEKIYIGVGSVAGLLLLIIIIVMIAGCCCECCKDTNDNDEDEDSTGSTRKKPEYVELDIVTPQAEEEHGYNNKLYEDEKSVDSFQHKRLDSFQHAPPVYQDNIDAVQVQVEQPVEHTPNDYGVDDEPVEVQVEYTPLEYTEDYETKVVAVEPEESAPNPTLALIGEFPRPPADEFDSDSNNSFDEDDEDDGDLTLHELMSKRDDPNVENEFYNLERNMPTALIYPDSIVSKNRRPDVFPWPDSRVVLSYEGNDPCSDYINASVVKNEKGYPAYIAAQGPLASTVNDFWRMVYEQSSNIIVMACPLSSQGQEKCAQYWPPDSVARKYGNLVVQLKKKELKTDFVASTVALRSEHETREVYLYRYNSWPTYGEIPNSAKSVVGFLLEVREGIHGNSGTLPIFHCSDGIGMAAVCIAITEGMIKLEETGRVNVRRIVRLLRKDLAGAVESAEQYRFIYTALCEYASYLNK
ncbi:uncharacterized protein LOC130640831 [Hydractinia symbiolongicarpus]|uniref:uncharacterized protein LOC130640831 n=1 Tax=Hydractinia symbiolongicarpus TaxID=13093 RepID=UPI00255088E6|nr:uncharacterized protein LOC130640831 [Hydractinia symbiolongicarpus]